MTYVMYDFLNLGSSLGFYCVLICAVCCLGVLAVWTDPTNPDEREEIKERLTSAVRTACELISFVAAHRESGACSKPFEEVDGTIVVRAIDDEHDEEHKEDASLDLRKEKAAEELEKNADDGKTNKRSSRRAASSDETTVNHVQSWREDYWNFENSTEGDLFAADEEQKNASEEWRESLDEDSKDASSGAQEKERDDTADEQDDREGRGKSRANYFGAFFRSRNYPSDVYEDSDEDESSDAPKRWRRNKKAPEKNATDGARSDAEEKRDVRSNVSNSHDEETSADWDSSLTDADFDALFNGADAFAAEPFESDETEERFSSEEEDECGFEPDYDYLDDESVSDDEKIDYLRNRVQDGDYESRETLVQMLIQRAALAKSEQEKVAMESLDEAENLLKEESDPDEIETNSFENDRSEILAQVLLQRPFFYLRNGLEPSMELANAALIRIRKWVAESPSDESRRMLATALQVHGNSLYSSGGDAAALSSLFESRKLFYELVESGLDEARPSIGFVCALIGEAYRSIGDYSRAAEYYRESLETFELFSDKEAFLAEKVNVSYRLSVVLRKLERDAEADSVLEEAIEGEERLLSYDEESYFAPLTTLLEAQADVCAQRGESQEALASLDRAIETLERFLSYDSLAPRRVLAYAHLENALRRRAVVYLGLRRFAMAARDLDKAAEYLALAAKKSESFDPLVQTTIVSCLIFDMCVLEGLSEDGAKLDSELKDLIKRLSSDERKHVVPIYAQLLLQRRNALLSAGKKMGASVANDEAIQLLEEACQDDDVKFETQVDLAKALIQRGITRANNLPAFMRKENKKGFVIVSAKDVQRAKAILEGGAAGGLLDASDKKVYIDLLLKKAAAEDKAGSRDLAADELRTAIRMLVSCLRAKQWSFIEFLALASQISLNYLQSARGVSEALHAVRVWLRFVERVRREYVEFYWTPGQQGNASKNERYMQFIDVFTINIKSCRLELLSTVPWEPEFAQYCDLSPVGRKPIDAAAQDSVRQDLLSADSGDKIAAYLERASRVLDGNAYEEERRRFIEEREAIGKEEVAKFCDRDSCLRILRRRVKGGYYEYMQFLQPLLDKFAEQATARGDILYVLAETLETTRLFESKVNEFKSGRYDKVKDSELLTNVLTLLGLKAGLLSRLHGEFTERVKETPAADASSAKLRDACLQRIQAEVDKAFLETIVLAKAELIGDPSASLRLGSVVSEYFSWLLRCGRKEEGVEFIRKEGALLERAASHMAPLGMLAVSVFYDSVANAALEQGADNAFTRETLLKVEKALLAEKNFVGEQHLVLERLGAVYERLGTVERNAGSEEQALEYYRTGARYYLTALRKAHGSSAIFNRFVQLTGFLFEYGGELDGRTASKYFHAAERLFETNSKKFRRETVEAYWNLTLNAKTWYEQNRRSFYSAKRLLDSLDRLAVYFDRSSLLWEYKTIEANLTRANFWIRFNSWKRATEALQIAIPLLKKHKATIAESKPEESGNIDRPYRREVALTMVRRQLLLAYMLQAQLIACGGAAADSELYGVDLDATLAEAFKLAEEMPETRLDAYPKRTVVQEAKRFCQYWYEAYGARLRGLQARIGSIFGKRKQEGAGPQGELENADVGTSASGTCAFAAPTQGVRNASSPLRESLSQDAQTLLLFLLLRCLSIVRQAARNGVKTARSSFRALLVDLRRVYGKDSFAEVLCRYFWSDVMLRSKRWTGALRSARYVLAQFPKNVLDTDCFIDDATPFLIDSYRIAASAAFERGFIGDEARSKAYADKTIEACRSAFQKKRFFMLPVYLDALFVSAKLERKSGSADRAYTIAKTVLRRLQIGERRGVLAPSPDVVEKVESFIAAVADELQDRKKSDISAQSEPGEESKEDGAAFDNAGSKAGSASTGSSVEKTAENVDKTQTAEDN